jgi:hypothetical protein
VFVIYLIALYPAILSNKSGYFVLSGSNWQDTPMHLSITESITEGNFPPQAPYFSGVPLSYYYFMDFHSSIIELAYGKFFPKVFVFSNSLLATIFFLSVYSFSKLYVKNNKLLFAPAFLSTFFSSYHFQKFIVDLYKGAKITDLLSHKSYSMEYNGIFGMANVSDYFLQNRPMMIGLPAFATVATLVVYGIQKKDRLLFFFAGLITGLLIKFHFFSLIASVLFVILQIIINFRKSRLLELLQYLFIYFGIIFGIYLIFGIKNINEISFIEYLVNSVKFESWNSQKNTVWHILFISLNLGLPFLICCISLFVFRTKKYMSLILPSIIFVAIPYVVRFTLVGADMIKFFYFSVVLLSIIFVIYIDKVIINKKLKYIALFFVLLSSTFSSFLTLSNSYYNKNFAYSNADYQAGLWIRENTPKNAIFITYPSVHNSASDIAGRIRVLSYINWPYSHGFNEGRDNVFTRVDDVNTFYNDPTRLDILNKYGVNYVYFGGEERSNYQISENKLESVEFLEKVYEKEDIKVFRIKI